MKIWPPSHDPCGCEVITFGPTTVVQCRRPPNMLKGIWSLEFSRTLASVASRSPRRGSRLLTGIPVVTFLSPLTRTVLDRSEEHTSELQSRFDLVCRLLLEKKMH